MRGLRWLGGWWNCTAKGLPACCDGWGRHRRRGGEAAGPPPPPPPPKIIGEGGRRGGETNQLPFPLPDPLEVGAPASRREAPGGPARRDPLLVFSGTRPRVTSV